MNSNKIIHTFTILTLFLVVFGLHLVYEQQEKADVGDMRVVPVESQGIIKMFNLGLHSALASFLWVDVRTHLPYLRDGFPAFWNDINLVIGLDEKFPTPYVHSLLLLPESEYEDKIEVALSLGRYGVENASPDWRIPFYVGSLLHLHDGDRVEAARYFDIAADRPGIPEVVRSYALNYGLLPTVREQSIGIWEAIHDTAEDEVVRERALLHIDHLEKAGIVEEAVAEYFNVYGEYPETIGDILDEGFLEELPESPFDVRWRMYPGGIVGVEHS